MPGTRRWPRIDLALRAEVRLPGSAEPIETETVNVSSGGLFLRLDPQAAVGAAMALTVHAGGQQIALQGLVVRTVPDPDDPSPQQHLPRGVGVVLLEPPVEWVELVETERRVRVAAAAGS